VFHNVMDGALRLMDVPPDNIEQWYADKSVPVAAPPMEAEDAPPPDTGVMP